MATPISRGSAWASITENRSAMPEKSGLTLPLVLVVLGQGLRELDSDAVDGARRRGALVGLGLAAITLLAALAFLNSLGVEVPWRF